VLGMKLKGQHGAVQATDHPATLVRGSLTGLLGDAVVVGHVDW
jgi:hypothetical protein